MQPDRPGGPQHFLRAPWPLGATCSLSPGPHLALRELRLQRHLGWLQPGRPDHMLTLVLPERPACGWGERPLWFQEHSSERGEAVRHSCGLSGGFPVKPGLLPRLCFKRPSICSSPQETEILQPWTLPALIFKNDFWLFLAPPQCPSTARPAIRERSGGRAGVGSWGTRRYCPRRWRARLGKDEESRSGWRSEMCVGILQSASGQECLGEGSGQRRAGPALRGSRDGRGRHEPSVR